MYNLSWTNSANTTTDIVQGVNNASGGYLGVSILVFIFSMMVLIISRVYGNILHGILVGSFTCAFIGGLLLAAQLILWEIVGIFIVIFFISLFISIWAWKNG